MCFASASRRAARIVCSCVAVAAAHAILPPCPAHAADNAWTVLGGDWQTPANWSLGHVPIASENVLVTLGTGALVNYIPSPQPPAAYVPPALGHLLIDVPRSPSALGTLSMTWGYRLDAGAVTVGQSGQGEISHFNGTLNIVGQFNLATQANGKGAYTLYNAATLNAAEMSVGRQGEGTFTQYGGQANIAGRFVIGGFGPGVYHLAGGATTANSVIVGESFSGTGTLNFTGGTLSGTGQNSVLIGQSGDAQVVHSGGTLSGSRIVFANSSDSTVHYRLTGSAAISGANSIVGRLGAITFLQTGGTHTASSILTLAEQLGSNVFYQLSGGLLSSAFLILNPNSTLHHTAGTLRTGLIHPAGGEYLWNAGTLHITSDLPIPAHAAIGGRSTLNPEHSLLVQGLTTLQVPLTLDGGVFSTGNLAANGAGALHYRRGNLSVTGPGPATILGAGQPLGQTLAIPSASTVSLAAGVTVQPDAIVSVDGGRLDTMTAQNHGLIHLSSPVSRFVATSLTNNPTGRLIVAGDASVTTLNNAGEVLLTGDTAALRAATFSNTGLLRGRGTVYSSFTNAASGEVQAEAGQKIRFLPSANPANALDNAINFGRLSLLGGALDFDTPALNNLASGIIAGRGTLTANVLDNAGAIHLSAGLSDIFAPLNNIRGGSVIVTGNAVATFHGPVNIDERTTFNVSAGATAVFLAPVNNSGLVTGGGVKHFEAKDNRVGALSTTGASVVEPAGSVSAIHIREASLTIHGTVQILPNGTPASASRLGSLTIHPAGRLDLTNNDLILDNADSSAFSALISSGLLTTTSATPITHLAAIPNRSADGSPLFATFDGLPVDASAVLVKYTYKGDTDLDGRITLQDYFNLDRGRALRLPAYQNGDFNYSGGSADADDYALIDRSFLSQSAPLSFVPSSAAPLSPLPHFPTPPSSSASPVPEPTALTLLLLPLPLTLLSRRRGLPT